MQFQILTTFNVPSSDVQATESWYQKTSGEKEKNQHAPQVFFPLLWSWQRTVHLSEKPVAPKAWKVIPVKKAKAKQRVNSLALESEQFRPHHLRPVLLNLSKLQFPSL